MTENTSLFISNICYAIVAGNFAAFTNPANCGPSFTWAGFPAMMARQCRTDIFMYVRLTKKNTEEIQKYAEELGLDIANRLLYRANLGGLQ